MLISESTRYALQYIVASSIERLYSFRVSDEVLVELTQIMKEYMDQYVHHRFKSMEILKQQKELWTMSTQQNSAES